MNNSKLSNTGMLKIASRWLQLLRTGKLSKPNFDRITGRAALGSKIGITSSGDIDKNFIPENAFSALSIPTLTRTRNLPLKQIRRGLSKDENLQLYKNPTHLKNVITNNYRTSFSKDTISNLNTNKLSINRTGEGMQQTYRGPYYDPVNRKIFSPRELGHPITRHEIGHAMHHSAPQMFEKDVAANTYRMMRQWPYLQNVMPGPLANKTISQSWFGPENAAQWIASRGGSPSSKRFIKSWTSNVNDKSVAGQAIYRNATDEKVINNILEQSYKYDPTGRQAASLMHFHNNYKLDMPSELLFKAKSPELFNPNPYLP